MSNEVRSAIESEIQSQHVIDFLDGACIDDILSIANIVKIVDGTKPNSSMSLNDYYVIQDALEEARKSDD